MLPDTIFIDHKYHRVYCESMKSKWFDLKKDAINLRRNGKSIREIEKILKVPKSTLSGWLKNVILTKKQKEFLKLNSIIALEKARVEAVKWHNKQKALRVGESKILAQDTLSTIDVDNLHVLELAMSMLYLGEGGKVNTISMGNTNPKIIRFFIKCLNILYQIDSSKLKAELHLRSDQNEIMEIKYWSSELLLNEAQFKFVKDKRLIKSKTYKEYHGVCVVRCGRIDILRRLHFINSIYCDKIIGS